MGYRGYEHNHVEPQYPFGFGLSYTTFSFSKLKAAPAGDGRCTVTFDVTNTGKRKITIQLPKALVTPVSD